MQIFPRHIIEAMATMDSFCTTAGASSPPSFGDLARFHTDVGMTA